MGYLNFGLSREVEDSRNIPEHGAQQNIKWVDGLRGLASFLVVSSHITYSLAPFLLAPAPEENGTPLLLQPPILHNLVIGRPSVAVFAILLGFANGIKPTKCIRSGHLNDALSTIARSPFRRATRFIIPATMVTLISWLICQYGAYDLSKSVDSWWLRDTSPSPSGSFAGALIDLFNALVMTWTDGGNPYDKVQWTLCHLLRGSMLVNLTLFATAHLESSSRILTYGVLYSYYYAMGDALIGINIFVGLLLVELQFSPSVQDYVKKRSLLFAILSSSAMFLGLFAASFPEVDYEWASWSASMHRLGFYIFPAGAETERFYPAIGAQIFCVGVMFNDTAKRLLSSPWLSWLGKHSFAIYLIHAPLVRTLLAWMVFGLSSRPPSPGIDEDGALLPQPFIPLTSHCWLFVIIPLFFVILYRLAIIWVALVDPFCNRLSSWVEDKVFKSADPWEK